MKKTLIFLIVFVLSCLFVGASSFDFNGTVYDPDGNALNATVVNVTVYNNSFGIVSYNSTTTNESGWFNMSLDSSSGLFYSPVITKEHENDSYIQYVNQKMPSFPAQMIQGISGTNFYLQEAGTLNITAVNRSNSPEPFRVQIRDQATGYLVAEDQTGGNQSVFYVPKNRNYSIFLMPNETMPTNFNWNNFSSASNYTFDTGLSNYNNTTSTLHKQFNTTMGFARVHGFVNHSNVNNGWDDLDIISYMVEPGNLVHVTHGAMPYNLSMFFDSTNNTDEYDDTTGYYNISLPSTVDGATMLLMAVGRNGTAYYGSLSNLTLDFANYPAGEELELNFTMFEMLGSETNASLTDPTGGSLNIATGQQLFTIVNSSNGTFSDINAHIEATVDYSSTLSIPEITWNFDIEQGTASTFRLPLLNVSGVGIKEMNIFVSGGNYAPVLKQFTNTQLHSEQNITIDSFNPGDIDDINTKTGIKIALFRSNSTCDVPYPLDKCVIGGDSGSGEDFSSFNPMKSIIGGGKLSFRMGLFSTGIIVHYVNVDMIASGPPDALFDNEAEEGTSDGFSAATRFGSKGPKIYDHVLISMPYTPGSSTQTGLDESNDINLSIPLIYDDDWNVIWNTSANGTNATDLAGNFTHYSSKASQWQYLLDTVTCGSSESGLNITNPCFANTTDDRVWIRLPHFSGTGPSVSGAVVTASSSSSSSSSSSGSSGGGGGGSTTQEATGFSKQVWSVAKQGESTSLTVKDKDVGVSSITFSPTKDMYGLWMKAEKVSNLPTDVPAHTQEVYKYVQITKNVVYKDEDLGEKTIAFSVEKAWLSKVGILQEEVSLLRYHNGEWQDLGSKVLSDDDTYVNYEAQTPGFSYFAIGVKNSPESLEEKPAAAEQETQAQEPASQEPTGESEEGPAKEESSNAGVIWTVVIIVLLGIVLLVWFTRRRQ